MITDVLQRIANHRQSLTREEARAVMGQILAGEATDAQIAALLVALHMKGETVEEIVGFAEAIRAAATPLAPASIARKKSALDVSGTERSAGRYLRDRRRCQRHLQHLYLLRAGAGRGGRARCQARQSQRDLEMRVGRCGGSPGRPAGASAGAPGRLPG